MSLASLQQSRVKAVMPIELKVVRDLRRSEQDDIIMHPMSDYKSSAYEWIAYKHGSKRSRPTSAANTVFTTLPLLIR